MHKLSLKTCPFMFSTNLKWNMAVSTRFRPVSRPFWPFLAVLSRFSLKKILARPAPKGGGVNLFSKNMPAIWADHLQKISGQKSPFLTLYDHFSPFLVIFSRFFPKKRPGPGPQKGRGQFFFSKICPPSGPTICKRLQVKKAHFWPFVTIFRRFWPFLLQLCPVPANFRPEKWPEPKSFIDNNMLDTWAELLQKTACL